MAEYNMVNQLSAQLLAMRLITSHFAENGYGKQECGPDDLRKEVQSIEI